MPDRASRGALSLPALKGGVSRARLMKVNPETDECTGEMVKRIGEMACYFSEQDYSYACDFSINIARQTIEYGLPC